MRSPEDDMLRRRCADAMRASTRLIQEDRNEEALRVLDDAIGMVIGTNERECALTLCHHAANISRFMGELSRMKQYYQQSLDSNPENPRALSGLADVAKEQGELELARKYAARCYRVLLAGDDFLKKERLETLLHKWPDIATG